VCLLVVAAGVVPGAPLLIGANRDEVLDRPATPVTVLQAAGPRILGGRDARAGGTWLAVNEHGVCAGLTNQPLGDDKDPTKRSRGDLPLALARHATASDAADAFVGEYDPGEYNGCYLLVGDRTTLWFVDFTGPGAAEATALRPGVHVLENRNLRDPSAKADLVRTTLGEPSTADEFDVALRAVLSDHRIPEGDERPNAGSCVHLDTFGPPRLWVAPGPPCTTPYDDVSSLWDLEG